MKTTRLNAIVDGVFAIAMTLLVLDLPRPNAFSQVTHDLEVHWDAYIAYLVSFATLGVVWLEHHGMMLAVKRTTRFFIEATFAFLLFVALLPWPTALTAQYADEASTSSLVTFMYTANMLLIAVSLMGSWAYLSRHPELLADDLTLNFQQSFRRTSLLCIPYLVAMPLALLSPFASILIDASVVVYLATTRSPLERAEAASQDSL